MGVRCVYYSPLWTADVLCFKNSILLLKDNFQQIKCKGSFHANWIKFGEFPLGIIAEFDKIFSICLYYWEMKFLKISTFWPKRSWDMAFRNFDQFRLPSWHGCISDASLRHLIQRLRDISRRADLQISVTSPGRLIKNVSSETSLNLSGFLRDVFELHLRL